MVQNLPCPDVSLEKMLEASEKKSLLLPDNGVWDVGTVANTSDNCHSVAIPPQIPKFIKTSNGPRGYGHLERPEWSSKHHKAG